MKITSKVITLAVVLVGIPGTLLPQSPYKKDLTGSWYLKIKVQHMPGTMSAFSFCEPGGGLMHIQPAGNDLVCAFGNWKQTGPGEFRVTLVTQMNDKGGAPTGSQLVQGTAFLSSSDDSVTGTAEVQYENREGKVVYRDTAKVEAHRVNTPRRLTVTW